MERAVTVEVTFVSASHACFAEQMPTEGLVRLADGSLRPFSGWIDLLGVLEHVAAGVHVPDPTRTASA